MDYLSRIGKCEGKVRSLSFKTGLIVITIACITALLIGSLILVPVVRTLFMEATATYVILSMMLLHALSTALSGIRYNTDKISRLKMQQSSEQLIRDKSEQFNTIYDSIMFELQARKNSNATYRNKFSILLDDCQFKISSNDPNSIIIHTKDGKLTADTIHCPEYMRSSLLYLLDNLGEVLK